MTPDEIAGIDKELIAGCGNRLPLSGSRLLWKADLIEGGRWCQIKLNAQGRGGLADCVFYITMPVSARIHGDYLIADKTFSKIYVPPNRYSLYGPSA